jgi:hypothetical protein
LVPRICIDLWIARLQGDHANMEGKFATAREQLNQKVEESLDVCDQILMKFMSGRHGITLSMGKTSEL